MKNELILKKRYPILQIIANFLTFCFFVLLVVAIALWITSINKFASTHWLSTQEIIKKWTSILSSSELIQLKNANFLLLASSIFYVISLIFAIIINAIITYAAYKNNWKNILIFSALGIFVFRLSGFIVGIILLKKIFTNR